MTLMQHYHVIDLLTKLRPEIIAHGDCIGADQEMHDAMRRSEIGFILHPASDVPDKYKANCIPYRWRWKPLPALVRDHNIVDSTDGLIAVPKQDAEILRSGTWATIRYATDQNKPIAIVYPTGRIEFRNGKITEINFIK